VNRDDIQGLLLSGYARLRASACIGVRFGEGQPHAWLRRLLPLVSSGSRRSLNEPRRINLSFTYPGLEKLGLDAATLAQFPSEFRQGMAHPECSRRLADIGADAPSGWTFGAGPSGNFDAVLLCYAERASELPLRLRKIEAELERWRLTGETLGTFLREDGREHFGFRMSVAQPRFRGDGRPRGGERRVPAGEFVLGYPDAAGETNFGPLAPARPGTRDSPPLFVESRRVALGFNGSYLVLRKLEQRSDRFRDFMAERAAKGTLIDAAAKLIGRWPNGASLALFPDGEPSDERADAPAGYRELDAQGFGCPLGAHVRRANPRDLLPAHDVDRHRLLRRSRLYDEGGEERGLLFMALNADIARQFEVVQGQWLNGAHFAGLREERDPLLGNSADESARHFSVQARPVRERLELPRWIRVRGGAYCFLPSLRALAYLADLRPLE
jgi:deferrochelatase/peroxidase EfeB